MRSIYLRNFLVTAATLFIGLILVVVSIVGLGRSYILEEYRLNMQNSAEEVARTAYAVSETSSLQNWNLSMTISAVSKATGNHIIIADESGKIVACCDDEPICEHIDRHVPAEAIDELDIYGIYNAQTDLGSLYDETRMVVGEPIENGANGEIIGFVFVSALQRSILSTWSSFLWIIIVVFASIFVALTIWIFWYSKHMTQPLDQIAEASRMFARGDFTARVKQTEDPSNEMGALIDSFNKMADSLETAEKHRTEFISNVSHELRTPMTTIAGFADGILDGTIPKEDEEKYLISIRDETRRLARLVRNMLDVSRMKTLSADPKRRTVFDVSELLLQTLLSFEQRAVGKNLDVDPQFPEEPVKVVADRDGITQVVYNLLDNAVKFAKPDSCITIGVRRENGKACISIKDEGETIPADDLPYIFDRFHKSDKSRSIDKDGVGLGLYLVKTIINGHDEDIAVKSENGITEFVFSLPLAEIKK